MAIAVGANTSTRIDVGLQSAVVNSTKVASGDLAVTVALAGTSSTSYTASGDLAISFPQITLLPVNPVIRRGPGTIPVDTLANGDGTDQGRTVGTGALPTASYLIVGAGITTFKGAGALSHNISLTGIGALGGEVAGGGTLPFTHATSGTGAVRQAVTGSGSLPVTHATSGAGTRTRVLRGSGSLLTGRVSLSGVYTVQESAFFVASVEVNPALSIVEVDTSPALNIETIKVRMVSG